MSYLVNKFIEKYNNLPAQDRPFNPANGQFYNGINDLTLSLAGHTDPRWLTASQLTQLGYVLKDNAMPVKIEQWFTQDKGGKPLEQPRLVTVEVYNGSQFDGIAAYEKQQNIDQPNAKIADLRKFIDDAVTQTVPGSQLSKDIYIIGALATNIVNRERGYDKDFLDMKKLPDSLLMSVSYKRGELDNPELSFSSKAVLRTAYMAGNAVAKAYEYFNRDDDIYPKLINSAKDRIAAFQKINDLGVNIGPKPAKEDKMDNTIERTYVNVPYDQRAEAKAQGAKYDPNMKSWYIVKDHKGFDLAKFPEHSPTPPLPPEKSFADFAQSHGLKIDSNAVVGNGKMQRVAVDGDKGQEKSGGYILHLKGVANGYISNFKRGIESLKWVNTKQNTLTAERVMIDDAKAQEVKNTHDVERTKQYEFNAKRAFAIIANKENQYADSRDFKHPYLENKGIKGHGIKVQIDANNPDSKKLLIPLTNIDGKIRSIQFINESGDKFFLPGGEKGGNFHLIDDKKEFKKPITGQGYADIYIAEGFATGASIHEATGKPVVVAFDAGNLVKVADNIRKAMPEVNICICADNDIKKEFNVGIAKATEAAELVNGTVKTPNFNTDQINRGLTDFNDLMKEGGKQAVQQELKGSFPLKEPIKKQELRIAV